MYFCNTRYTFPNTLQLLNHDQNLFPAYLTQDNAETKYVHLLIVLVALHHLRSHPVGIAHHGVAFLPLLSFASRCILGGDPPGTVGRMRHYPGQAEVRHDHSFVVTY